MNARGLTLMNGARVAALLALLSASGAALADMAPLDDAALADVDARAGIAMDFEFRINADATGAGIACPAVGSAGECRIGLSFAERRGMWITLKGYRGLIRLDDIRVDASNMPAGWTTRTAGGTQQNPYMAAAGFNPSGKPALQLSTAAWSIANQGSAGSFYTFLNGATYADFTTSLNIDRVSAEFDCGSAVNSAAGIHANACSSATAGWDDQYTPDTLDHVHGYLRSTIGGSALTVRIADGTTNPDAPARIRLDGRLQLSGY